MEASIFGDVPEDRSEAKRFEGSGPVDSAAVFRVLPDSQLPTASHPNDCPMDVDGTAPQDPDKALCGPAQQPTDTAPHSMYDTWGDDHDRDHG